MRGDGMATGNVYVFNTYYNEGVTLVLNNYYVGNLSAATAGTYAPTSTSIARNASPGNPGQAQFGGDNILTVAYGSGGTSFRYDVSGISFSDVPAEHDLQLYLFYNLAVLVKEADASPIPITGNQLTAEEHEKFLELVQSAA
jgi:hypothetical protein